MAASVLVIDDSEVTLEACRQALEPLGLEVDTLLTAGANTATASAIAEALKHTPEPPDLVLMDVTMPGLSGDDVTQLLKRTWKLAVPVLLYSELPEERLQIMARAAAADGYICKSWGIERMVERVRELIADRGAEASE